MCIVRRKRVTPLRLRRLALGLTLEAVAEVIGTSAQYVSLLEREVMPLTTDMRGRLGACYVAFESVVEEENAAA